MRRRLYTLLLVTLAFVGGCAQTAFVPTDDGHELRNAFAAPPDSARPWVFWYWMQGAASAEGITADLEAMKRVGIGGAYLMPIKPVPPTPLFDPPTPTMSPRWWEMVRHAMAEADRLGLKIAMHDCDGFATAGGPWITPEMAMQRLVWSEVQVEGGRQIEMALPQPPTKENYYRDVAVLAFPTPKGTGITTRTNVPKVTSDVPGVDPQGLVGDGVRFRSEPDCWFQYEFKEPFTCRSIAIRPGGKNYQGNRLILEVSDDGKSYRSLGRLEAPRHGWQDEDVDATHAIVPTTARFFRFEYDKEGTEPGSEDLDSAKWKNRLLVNGVELSAAPRIHHYEGKTGSVWRRANRTTAEQIPDTLCVPQDKIVNLTGQLGADGRLTWDAPPGRWTILRMGHTPTGHQNETGGAAKGLECDKFNPAAARLQFDRWFGETIRQVGPELTGRVLKIFHVDSWEAGSQNWSPVFAEEFKKRRGYDPTPYLPAMAGIPVASADVSERFLLDVRRTIADLTIDNFFGPMSELAHAHGCTFSAECTAPTMTGDGMLHFGRVDVPMGEFWLRSPTHDKPNDMLDAISAAHVYGKPLVQAEAFTELRMAWDEAPAMLKPLGDHNFCLGINRFVLHVFTHNPWMDRRPGMTLDGVGTYFQRDQTWWEPGRAWIQYLTRCQAMLQQGHHVADVAYFTGEDLPRRALLPDRYCQALPPGYTADSINPDALLRLATVRDGRIELPGGASYAVLVLPEGTLMTPEVTAKLRELVSAGAVVFGPAPERSPSLENFPAGDATVRDTAKELWSAHWKVAAWPENRFGKGRMRWGGTLEQVLTDSAGVTPDFIATNVDKSPAEGIEWTHRAMPDRDLYFVSNQLAEPREINVSLRVTDRAGEVWDPVTGETHNVPVRREEAGRSVVPVSLAPNGSVFIVLRKASQNEINNSSAPGCPCKSSPSPVLELTGPWSVAFDPQTGGPEGPVAFEKLDDWALRPEPGIRHYSGTAAYTMTFDWDTGGAAIRVWLGLGKVGEIAEVRVNDTDCGVAWTDPWRVEITKALRPGANKLEVRVTNTWANRLIGDHELPEADRLTRTTAPYRLEDKPLLPSGLLGPVKLLVADTALRK